jgi:hypothetical protein
MQKIMTPKGVDGIQWVKATRLDNRYIYTFKILYWSKKTPRHNPNRHNHAHKCLYDPEIEPVTSRCYRHAMYKYVICKHIR